jgi:hypothetical protein
MPKNGEVPPTVSMITAGLGPRDSRDARVGRVGIESVLSDG